MRIEKWNQMLVETQIERTIEMQHAKEATTLEWFG